MLGGAQRVDAGRMIAVAGSPGQRRCSAGARRSAGGHLTAIQRIVHGRVEPNAVFVQPVVDDPGHLREILLGFLLHQRGHYENVIGHRPSDSAVSTNPDYTHGAGAGIKVAKKPSADADGSMLKVPSDSPQSGDGQCPAPSLAQPPARHDKHRRRALLAAARRSATGDAALGTVEIHTGGTGDQREYARIHHAGLINGGVVELTPFQATNFTRLRGSVSRADSEPPGPHPIEPGLDRGNRGCWARGIDECSDGTHTVFEQRLPTVVVESPALTNHDVSLADRCIAKPNMVCHNLRHATATHHLTTTQAQGNRWRRAVAGGFVMRSDAERG